MTTKNNLKKHHNEIDLILEIPRTNKPKKLQKQRITYLSLYLRDFLYAVIDNTDSNTESKALARYI